MANRPEALAASGEQSNGSPQRNPTSDPNSATDPQEQRKHQGGRGTPGNDKGSQGGEDENGHGDNVEYPNKD